MILNIDQRQQYLCVVVGCPAVVEELQCVTAVGNIKALLSSWALWVETANLQRCWKSGGASAPCSILLWHWSQSPPWIRDLGFPRALGKAQRLQPARTVEPAGLGPQSASRANIWPKPAPRDRSTTSWRGPVGGSASSIILLCKYLHFHMIFGVRKIWNCPFNQPGISTWALGLKTCLHELSPEGNGKASSSKNQPLYSLSFPEKALYSSNDLCFQGCACLFGISEGKSSMLLAVLLAIELLYTVPASDTAVFSRRCGRSSCDQTHPALVSLFCSCWRAKASNLLDKHTTLLIWIDL